MKDGIRWTVVVSGQMHAMPPGCECPAVFFTNSVNLVRFPECCKPRCLSNRVTPFSSN